MNAPSWIGRSLGGRYQITELLGQGGMSAVYKALDPNLKRTVAIKLIHSHLSGDERFIRRFEEEAAAVAKLRHPNIVQVFDFNQDSGTFYMVLEFIPGETLQERLRRYNRTNRFLPLGKAVQYASDILSALDYAHQRGMVHRDIKPANIMLNVHDQAILMDFGIVKMLEGESHTATGAVVGTARYMPPEVIRGEMVDPRSDLYSFGVTLFEMISGRAPFEAESAMTLMNMHLTDPVPDPRGLRPDVIPELKTVLEKSLEKNRLYRYSSAAEMAGALQALQPRLAGLDATLSTGVEVFAPPPAAPPAYARTAVDPAPPAHTPPAAPTPPPAYTPAQALTPPAAYTPPPTYGGASAAATPPPPANPAGQSAAPYPQTRANPSAQLYEATAYQAPFTGASSPALQGPQPPAAAPAQKSPANLLQKFWYIPAILLVALVAFFGGSFFGGGAARPTATPTLDILAIARQTETAIAALIPPSATPEPSPTVTPTHTPEPSPTPTTEAAPTVQPSPTPDLFVQIKGVTLEGNVIVVFYETFGYTEDMNSLHIHFFFNTVTPENAGLPGSGPWIMYAGPRPFMGYKTSDVPKGATQMCALVANANHSVIQNSGTCFDLPTP